MPEEIAGQQITPQATEKTQGPELSGKERIKKRSKEILQDSKNGNNKEGAVVFNAFKEAAENFSPRLGGVSEKHKALVDAKDTLDEPGVPNKALTQLKDLYQEAGLGGYELGVEVEAGTSKDEREKLVREKIVSDIDGFSEAFATQHTLQEFAEPTAKVEELRNDLKKEVSKDDLSRNSIRQKSYQIARREADLQARLGTRLREVDGTLTATVDYYDAKDERTSYEANELIEFEDTKPDEMLERILKVDEDYEKKIEKDGRDDNKIAFETLDDGIWGENVSEIARLDFREEQLRANLEKAIEASNPQVISSLVSEIRYARLLKKDRGMVLDGEVAVQRVQQFVDRRQEARAKLADAMFDRESTNRGEEARKLVGAVVSEQVTRLRSVAERLGQVRILEDVAEEGAEWTKEQARGALNRVDENIGEAARGTYRFFKRSTGQKLKWARDRIRGVRSVAERTKTGALEGYYKGRHAVETGIRRNFDELAAWKGELSEELWVQLAGAVGGERYTEKRKQRIVEVNQKAAEEVARIDKEIDEREKDNPYLKRFHDRLAGKAREKPPEEEEVGEEKELTGSELIDRLKRNEDEYEQISKGDTTALNANLDRRWSDLQALQKITIAETSAVALGTGKTQGELVSHYEPADSKFAIIFRQLKETDDLEIREKLLSEYRGAIRERVSLTKQLISSSK